MGFVYSIKGMRQNRGSDIFMTDTLTFLCHGILLRIYTSMCVFDENLHLFNTRELTIIQLYYGKSSHENKIRVL